MLTIPPANESLTFLSPWRKRCDNRTLAAIGILLLISVFIGRWIGPFLAFIDGALLLILFYGFRAWYRCSTHIQVTEGFLSIEQESAKFQRTEALRIPINEVRGFEITQVSRAMYALVIYDKANNYYKYSLMRVSDHQALITFLSAHIPMLKARSNTAFPGFWKAFLFILTRWAAYLLISLALVTCFWLLNKHWLQGPVWFVGISIIAIGSAGWWFIMRGAAKQKGFRFSALYWLAGILFFGCSFFILPFIRTYINEAETLPLTVSKPSAINRQALHAIYVIEHVSYNPEKYLLSRYTIGSRNKGGSYTVTHQIASPLGDGAAIQPRERYPCWLLINYTQRLKKTRNFYTRIDTFAVQAKDKARQALRRKPVFYTPESKPNFFSPLKTQVMKPAANAPILLLAAHWESIATYKKNQYKMALLLSLGFLAMQLIGCLMMSSNR